MLEKTDEKSNTRTEKTPRSSAAIAALVAQENPLVAAGVPEGFDAYLLARMAATAHKELGTPVAVLHVARDDQRAEPCATSCAFSPRKWMC